MPDTTPESMYANVSKEFRDCLKKAGLLSRQQGRHRQDITLHSIRRFVGTTLEDIHPLSFVDYILGHITELHIIRMRLNVSPSIN